MSSSTSSPMNTCQAASRPSTMPSRTRPVALGQAQHPVDDDGHEELRDEVGVPVGVRHHARREPHEAGADGGGQRVHGEAAPEQPEPRGCREREPEQLDDEEGRPTARRAGSAARAGCPGPAPRRWPSGSRRPGSSAGRRTGGWTGRSGCARRHRSTTRTPAGPARPATGSRCAGRRPARRAPSRRAGGRPAAPRGPTRRSGTGRPAAGASSAAGCRTGSRGRLVLPPAGARRRCRGRGGRRPRRTGRWR